MIEVEKESSPIQIMQEKDDIERQKSNNKKYDLINNNGKNNTYRR